MLQLKYDKMDVVEEAEHRKKPLVLTEIRRGQLPYVCFWSCFFVSTERHKNHQRFLEGAGRCFYNRMTHSLFSCIRSPVEKVARRIALICL